MSKIIWSVVFAIAAIGFVAASEIDYREAKAAENEYCAMVKLYKSSHGLNGYPDFKGVYGKWCEHGH